MTDAYENKIDNMVPKFRHNQKIDIISGFYRENVGIVTGYIVKDGKIYYNVDISDLNIVLFISEDDMREQKRDRSWISRMLRK